MKNKCNIAAIILLIIVGILLYLILGFLRNDNFQNEQIHYLNKKIEEYRLEINDRDSIIGFLHTQIRNHEDSIQILTNKLADIQDQSIPEYYSTMPADDVVREFLRRHSHTGD